jgi:acyl carrier protein
LIVLLIGPKKGLLGAGFALDPSWRDHQQVRMRRGGFCVLTVTDVCDVIRAHLGVKLPSDVQLSSDTSLDALGLSSLQVAELVVSIEERTGIEFDPAAAAEVTTLGELVELANGHPADIG